MRTKVFIPIHLDVLAVPVRRRDGDFGKRAPEARWIVDPIDYTRPWVYSPRDARWFDSSKRSAVQQFCEGNPDGDESADEGRDRD